MRANGRRKSNQILHGDQTRREENFYRVAHAPLPWQKIVTRMLTRDMFAVANLLVSLSLFPVRKETNQMKDHVDENS